MYAALPLVFLYEYDGDFLVPALKVVSCAALLLLTDAAMGILSKRDEEGSFQNPLDWKIK